MNVFRELMLWASLFLAAQPFSSSIAAGTAKYFVLIVWDGMRPDFVSAELTPNLCELRDNGVWFANHHSAYPTSTEVNGTVLATGVFPQRSGVLANKEFRPEINLLKQVGMESLETVRRGDDLSGGKYIHLQTVAELVQKNGEHSAVSGAKPVALLHDRLMRTAETQNFVWFAGGTLPENLRADLTNRFGNFPAANSPNTGRDSWATRCLIESFWAKEVPRYSVLWLSEPDYSQHHHGPGSPEALAGIKNCDDRLGEVMSALKIRGVRDQTDIFVVSDHGFSTIGQNGDVAAALRHAGVNAQTEWKNGPTNDDVTVVGNGGSVLLYVANHSAATIKKIVATLQRNPAGGVIITRDGMPGTFPLAEVKLDSPMAADVILASGWKTATSDSARAKIEIVNDGYAEYSPGDGMHVTLAPTDLHNLAVASGPDFKRGITSPIPSGNVDIAPTFLWLMGITPPEVRDGRVLSEALTDTKAPEIHGVNLGRLNAHQDFPGGTWEQYLKFTEVNGVRYLEEANGHWSPKAAMEPTK